jgi:glycerol-3-phosphate dehydrogenase
MSEPRHVYDLAVIGGGVNGCGIARDAAGRGLSVLLLEQNDLASGTSSWSTKLIHGGLRYLEHYKFRLVREALIEREVLWTIAPHIIHPLRFVLPHHKGLRPAWLLRLGLFLYDHLGGRKRLPSTRTLDLTCDEAGKPLTPGHSKGFEYSDCSVDDTRLVVLNARDAADRGAKILPYHKLVDATRMPESWQLTAQDSSGMRHTFTARTVINAAGPWVDQVLTGILKAPSPAHVRLVQGSHIVTRKLFDHDRAYIFQNADGRVIFAIPYQGDFTLIGTTDRDYQGDPADVCATQDEIAYLCVAASEYFTRTVTPDDVVWAFSGVRPLYDDGASTAQEATRDYVLVRDKTEGMAPLLSVFGGKITTYRRLAEEVLERMADVLPPSPSALSAGWTGEVCLPGGEPGIDGMVALTQDIAARYPFLDDKTHTRLIAAYGGRVPVVLGSARSMADLGRDFGGGLSQREVDYLRRNEWAISADDVLWRRSKLGLVLDQEQQTTLRYAMAQKP